MLNEDTVTQLEPSLFTAKFLTAKDYNVAASLLYQAYHDDPLFRHIFQFRDDKLADYEKKLRMLIREELTMFWQQQAHIVAIFHQQNMLAVSCIQHRKTGLVSDRAWHWRLKLLLSAGVISTNQLLEKEKRLDDILQAHPDCCFISLFAVDPHVQNQGVGRYMLRAIDDVVKTEGAKASALFVTQNTALALFLSEGYASVQTLAFSNISGTLLLKKT